ncbi:MAG TPA: DMT family transporter [Planctomycetota bacterium]
MPYLGEICALCTALCWTGSSMSFAVASRAAGPLGSNQFRLIAGVPVLLALAWLTTGHAWPAQLPQDRLVLLVLSGVTGLVLGDFGFFYALATIGPRHSSVVMATWPLFAMGIALGMGEPFTPGMLVGASLLMTGVLLVLLRSSEGASWNPGLTRRQLWTGVLGALLGAAGQAAGVVLARVAMATGPDLPEGVVPLQATVVRMVTALVGLMAVSFLLQRGLAFVAVCRHRNALGTALLGAAFGPVAGVWLSMVATRYAANVGVAAALMATTPIFMMPVSALVYGARIGRVGVAGTVLAVAGAAVVLITR